MVEAAAAAVQALAAVATLSVTYRLAQITKQYARDTKRMADQMIRQPCVVIEWELVRATTHGVEDGFTYVARNIGDAPAFTVVYITESPTGELWEFQHLGALAAGQSNQVPMDLLSRLRDEATKPLDRRRHVVLAQGTGDGWVITSNLMESGGRLAHFVKSSGPLSDEHRARIHKNTLEEAIHEKWPQLQPELDAMLRDLGRGNRR